MQVILNDKVNADSSGINVTVPSMKRPNSTSKKIVYQFTAAAIDSLYRTSFIPSLLDIHKALREAEWVGRSMWVVR